MKLPEVNSKRWLSLEDFNGEVWKTIPHLGNNYAISNYGRLKSLAHTVRQSYMNRTTKTRTRIVRQTKSKYGYLSFRPMIDGKLGNERIHRLVAIAFVPNPNNLPFVNHKDENKQNNMASNLEWCTAKYNSNYGTCQSRRAKTLSAILTSKSEIINQYDLEGNFVRSFQGKRDIVEAGLCYETIRRCCKHSQKTSDGYVYRFDGDDFSLSPNKTRKYEGKKVVCLDLHGNYIATYKSAREASIAIKGEDVILPGISRCCRGGRPSAYGYKWRYA